MLVSTPHFRIFNHEGREAHEINPKLNSSIVSFKDITFFGFGMSGSINIKRHHMSPSPYQSLNWLEFLRKSDDALLRLCRVDYYKATGKGGQKRNKTENAVRLTLSSLSVTDSSTRTRTVNLQQALRKLRMEIALNIENYQQGSHLKRFPEETTPYLQGSLIRINPSNSAFPFFIASLIDTYTKHRGDWRLVAEDFKVSVTQIQKFVQKHGFFASVLARLEMWFLEGDSGGT